MVDVVIATRNSGKLIEIKNILRPLEVSVVSLAQFPEIKPIEETGITFKQNAILKAQEVAFLTGAVTLADDSGLEVDCLNGQPSIRSSRFAGENATDSMNNAKLLDMMKNIPANQRQARFVCVMALAAADKLIGTVTGICQGYIAQCERGLNGFGYDPLFIARNYNITFAQLQKEIKNKISHRAKALNKAAIMLEKYLLRDYLSTNAKISNQKIRGVNENS
ncbi:XTP/dITP diphosphatase [bacterium]|nr:XTP/dITP diphosphatase [bacterium]